MNKGKLEKAVDYQEILDEIEALRQENNHLKKAVGELTIDKKILETANEIYKKKYREKLLKQQKKSSKK